MSFYFHNLDFNGKWICVNFDLIYEYCSSYVVQSIRYYSTLYFIHVYGSTDIRFFYIGVVLWGVVRWSLMSWRRQPIFLCVYADHLSLMWVTVWHRLQLQYKFSTCILSIVYKFLFLKRIFKRICRHSNFTDTGSNEAITRIAQHYLKMFQSTILWTSLRSSQRYTVFPWIEDASYMKILVC